MVEGLATFHHGFYAEAVELLMPVRINLWQIGGSHAQRDFVDWTLTEAARRRPRARQRTPPTRRRSAPNRRFLRHA